MNNSKFVFVIKEADRAMVEAFYQKNLKEYDFPPSQLWIEITERCRDLPISMIKKTGTALREAGTCNRND